MVEIPARCVGCPALELCLDERGPITATLDEMAKMVGVDTHEEINPKLLEIGLDATQDLTGTPDSLRTETMGILIDAYDNSLWARGMSFGQYLDRMYHTREPEQFKTIIERGFWESMYDVPFDTAMDAFNGAVQSMDAQIEKDGAEEMQNTFSASGTETYDMIDGLLTKVVDIDSEMTELIEGCKDGKQTKRKMLKTQVSCGSVAVKNT